MNNHLCQEVGELAEAIGDRKMEIKYGSPAIRDIALTDLAKLSQLLAKKVHDAIDSLGGPTE